MARGAATTPQGADALLFDLGKVVIDIDFNRAFARWAAHAGCAAAILPPSTVVTSAVVLSASA